MAGYCYVAPYYKESLTGNSVGGLSITDVAAEKTTNVYGDGSTTQRYSFSSRTRQFTFKPILANSNVKWDWNNYPPTLYINDSRPSLGSTENILYTFTSDDDTYTRSCSNTSTNIWFIGNIIDKTQQFQIDKSALNNVTVSPAYNEIDSSSDATFTFTANDGYEISGNVYGEYINSSGETTGVMVQGSGNVLTLTAEQTTYSDTTAGIKLFATVNAITHKFSIDSSSLSNVTVSPDSTEIDSGTAITFTFTAASGYEISGNVYGQYINSSGETTSTTVQGSGNVLTLTAEQTTYSDTTAGIKLYATVNAITQKFKIDKSALNNVTVSPDVDEIDSGTAITFTFTAASGYEISGNVYGQYINSSGAITGSNVRGSGNVLELPSDATTYSSTMAGIRLRASVSEITPIYIAPTYHLENCTISPQPEQIASGQQYNFTFTATDGYSFESNPYIVSTDASGNTIRANAIGSGGTYTLTTTFTLGESSTIDIYATATQETKKTVNVEYSLTDCTVSPQPTVIDIGDTVTLTLSPNSGYYFSTQPTATYTNLSGTTTTIDGVNAVLSFTITDSDIAEGSTITVTGSAVAMPKTNVYGTVAIYKITGDTLTNIEAFNRTITADPVPTLTDNIASVRVFYCPVSDTGIENYINLGLYKTNVSAPEIPPDTITINCGEIKIEGTHKNVLDYNDEIEFWLPFVGTIPVNTNRVMDKTITLRYKVNVFDGSCTAILYDGDIAIAYGSGNISFEIPYGVNDNYQISSQLAVEPNYLLDLTPNVTIRSEIAMDGIRYNDNHKVNIGEQNGYCAFNDFTLNGIAATQPELNLISQQLQSGIIL